MTLAWVFASTSHAKDPATAPATQKVAKPVGPGRGEVMDYGPFLSYSVLRPKEGATKPAQPSSAVTLPRRTDGGDVLAAKGISIRVGNGATVCFDTDSLSLAGGWTGGFLDIRNTNLNKDKGDLPAIAGGPLEFSTMTDPGWAKGDSFADPRAAEGGPLPAAWAHYRGLYRNGLRVVLSYTVGAAEVLELDDSVADGGHVAYTRTLRVGPSAEGHRLNVCELPGARGGTVALSDLSSIAANKSGASDAVAAVLSRGERDTIVAVIGAPRGAMLDASDDFRISLSLPPLTAPATIKVVIANVASVQRKSFAALLKAAGPIEDPQRLCMGGPSLWPQAIVTKGARADDKSAYVVDTVRLPDDNPWKSWMRPGGFDFFADGRAAVCTWNGDVWIVSGLDASLSHITWRRFAAGLYESLGLRIVNDVIYVLGRDQITRLHDLNGDGEADYYENFCNAWPTSPVYHAFNMDLQNDAEGNFYFATCGNQASPNMTMKGVVLKVPKSGGTCAVYCTGLRAPNGMGVGPHGEITASDNQGHWTPVDRINLVKPGGFYGFVSDPRRVPKGMKLAVPESYDPPLCFIRYPEPDNSAGAQVWARDDWGPLGGHLLCTSYGKAALLDVMQETVGGVAQGGVLKLPLKFEAGIMRARVSPSDGQVWVAGLKGWQTSATRDGCFQRIRYTGKPLRLPVALHVLPAGLSITFSDPLDPELATDEQSYGIQQWNYHWHSTYGSPEYKLSDPNATGHDEVAIKSVKLSPDRKTVTLETGPLKPVMQMAVEMHLKAADGGAIDCEIDNTINRVPDGR